MRSANAIIAPGSKSDKPGSFGPARECPLTQSGHERLGVAERELWNVSHPSGWIFAALITLAHFSVSAAMNLPNSAGVIGIGTAPKSASRALILGSARAALISLLSLSMISV